MIKRTVLMIIFLTLAAKASRDAVLNPNIWRETEGVLYSSILNKKSEQAMISILHPGSRWASLVFSFFSHEPCDPFKNTADILINKELETVNFKCETFGDMVIFSYTILAPSKANAFYQVLRSGKSILIERRFLILPSNIRDKE